MISECHKTGHGIEGQIYEKSELHYAYQALKVCQQKDFMSDE